MADSFPVSFASTSLFWQSAQIATREFRQNKLRRYLHKNNNFHHREHRGHREEQRHSFFNLRACGHRDASPSFIAPLGGTAKSTFVLLLAFASCFSSSSFLRCSNLSPAL
jgi:hypothetical protein